MRGEGGYAGGARRLVGAAAVVLTLAGVGVALGGGLVGRAESPPKPPPSVTSAATPSTPPSAPLDVPAAPRIVSDHLAFEAARKAETAAYSLRHYGVRTARLQPSMIVLHYTESDTYASVRSLFAADLPNRGEAPGTCAHYVVDQDGTIHELVPPTLRCRHTVGLNHVAIGIEFVQASHGHDPRWAAQQVLARRAQALAGASLVEHLQRRFDIPDQAVIGHAMANDSKAFRDLEGWRNDHVDWQQPEVVAFRRLLATAP
ncbi:N-acetylmuramoyl-L-alanine amidase [Pedococcus dokdonensis]|uniref:N-acetylmuramoyl-L-alanine amidase n=1 Tax=Pedococcus dokdonensis TaxID=443156 RepID=UPI0012FD3567|nr:peptidoglycan recognition family protein [Pedococcus dokdonensis]